MGHHSDKHSSSSRHKDKHKSKRRHRDDEDEGRSSGKKRSKKDKERTVQVVDDDVDDEDMWVEKNIDMDGEKVLATDIPTAESLKLVSHAETMDDDPPLPPPVRQETVLKRDAWMLPVGVSDAVDDAPMLEDQPMTDGFGDAPTDKRTLGGGVDFFSGLGVERKRKPPPEAPDPKKVPVSDKELNIQLKEGKSLDEYSAPEAPKAIVPGGPGSQWRMMRLRRVYETAEEEGRPIEEVAIDRFGSLAAFEEAKEERRILDEREGRRAERGRSSQPGTSGKGTPSSRGRGRGAEAEANPVRYMFTDVERSGASSRSSSFRRPDLDRHNSSTGPSTPSPAPPGPAAHVRGARAPGPARLPSQVGTPIPSVLTPSLPVPAGGSRGSGRAMSPTSLNKLQAKVLRAKLMGAPNAEALEREYEEALKAANGDDEDRVSTKVELLPTLDGRGRLYDTGTGKNDAPVLPGNRKKKEKVEIRDPKTGEIVRINADDDTTTLGDMLRQEKFGGGSADQKNLDAEFARQVMTDGGFQNDLDYMDDNAEKLARKKMRSDAMKRQFAINDYKKTQKALATCPFCYGEDDSPPKAPVVAMGTRAYLSRTINEELVDGHCLIVPIQHHLTMLEGDDDVWDEVKNFMKCLMKMFAEEDKGVVFFETVLTLKHQKHTFIECVPVPWEQFDDLPGYFKESILQSELEWSQHKKLIDFAARPGGFRRAMVPNLPYFMVQFDHKGEKGYGHVIEGVGEQDKEAEGDDIDEGEKGGGVFPRYFAGEIIGNILDIEPRRWRRPRKIDPRNNRERVISFTKKYDKYDWTGMLRQS